MTLLVIGYVREQGRPRSPPRLVTGVTLEGEFFREYGEWCGNNATASLPEGHQERADPNTATNRSAPNCSCTLKRPMTVTLLIDDNCNDSYMLLGPYRVAL